MDGASPPRVHPLVVCSVPGQSAKFKILSVIKAWKSSSFSSHYHHHYYKYHSHLQSHVETAVHILAKSRIIDDFFLYKKRRRRNRWQKNQTFKQKTSSTGESVSSPLYKPRCHHFCINVISPILHSSQHYPHHCQPNIIIIIIVVLSQPAKMFCILTSSL